MIFFYCSGGAANTTPPAPAPFGQCLNFSLFHYGAPNPVNDLQDIDYEEKCNEFTETKCKTVFDTTSEERCSTSYRMQCDMGDEVVTHSDDEGRCVTAYEGECHGYGYYQQCQKVRSVLINIYTVYINLQVPKQQCKHGALKTVPGRKW